MIVFTHFTTAQDNKNFVWISCKTVKRLDVKKEDSEKKDDREKIDKFEYFPRNRGIDLKFFPFIKTEDVQPPPLVAVMITPNSRFEEETSVEIECRAYHKGKSAMIHFCPFTLLV